MIYAENWEDTSPLKTPSTQIYSSNSLINKKCGIKEKYPK